MQRNDTENLKLWLIFLVSGFVFLSLLIIFVPIVQELIHHFIEPQTEELQITATAFGGLLLVINAYYAAKRAEAMDKTAIAAAETLEISRKNAELTEDRLITERFSRAVEQLVNDNIAVRLGGIYSLERIAKDSKKDGLTILEILTAFVRENADFKERSSAHLEAESNNGKTGKKVGEEKLLSTLKIDVQAALTVIGRLNEKNEEENQRLDLHSTDLRGADLHGASLQGVNFINANLQGANLNGANLQKVNLRNANLQNAKLFRVNLQGANLIDANLQGADLDLANLREAEIWKTQLQGARLRAANLQGAKLPGAKLQGANLSGVENLEAQQIELAEGDRTTALPDNIKVPAHWMHCSAKE